jgi:hypothetical protein
VCVQLSRRARWSSSPTPRPWRTVSRSLSTSSPGYRRQQLHRHCHRGGADPICVDHVFIGYGSDHAGYGSDHPSNGSNHADNLSTTSPLQRKDDRQHRPNRSYRPGRRQALTNPDFGRFNSKSIYRASTSSPQQIYPTNSGSPSNMTKYRSSGHRYS